MHGRPFCLPGRVTSLRVGSRGGGWSPGADRRRMARSRGGGTGGTGALPQVPAAHLRRGHRPGARHRAAVAGAAQRPAQPRLPLLRPARLRQDLQRPDPGPLAQLRAGPHARAVRASATRAASLAPDGAGSIDVIEIDAASHGGVDDARDLREKAFFAPARSRFKIYVIDEAHMVSSAGFNALLKLVEEPPEYVKFIFATTEPEKVLGTIKSRTHHYPFRLIPPKVLRPYLEQLCRGRGRHGRAGGLPAGGARRRRQRPGQPLRARPAHRRRRPGGRRPTPGPSRCSASPTPR